MFDFSSLWTANAVKEVVKSVIDFNNLLIIQLVIAVSNASCILRGNLNSDLSLCKDQGDPYTVPWLGVFCVCFDLF